MEISFLALALGLTIGLQIAEITSRRKLLAKLLESETKATEAARVLSELHNKQVENLKNLTDRVNNHEIVIKTNATNQNTSLGRKF